MKRILTSLVMSSVISVSALAEVVVITNTSNGNAIAASDVGRIFLGKTKSFADGSKIIPVNLAASSSARGEFEQKALKKSASQLKAYWSKQVFTGKGKPPKDLGSDADVISFVGSNAGAIGYVDAASVNDSVKVVAKY